jgi:hypothetical protein
MAGEAQILANRRKAVNSPQRHRDHRDDPQFADADGSDFILRALCVSVVKIHAEQSQFPETKMIANCFVVKGLRGIVLKAGYAKQSQSSRMSQGNETVSGAEPVRRALDVVAEVSDGGFIADFAAVA